MTTAISELNSRRVELAANLNAKGVAAKNTETLKELIPKVLNISGSGTVDPPGPIDPVDPLDPTEVYKTTRPADWLAMPSVKENEIYLLFRVAPPAENYVSFTVTCTGSYTVEYGTVRNGAFVASGKETVASGTAYQGTFFYNDWADDTSDGKRQVMLRITGTDILTFSPADHSARNYRNFRSWGIVEFKGNLPSCTSCTVGNFTAVSALQQLRYFTIEGTNKITSFASAFRNCNSLTAIPALDTSKGTNFGYMFNYCYSLTTIPALDTSKGTNFNYMFAYCRSLTSIPELDTSKGTNFSSMFAYCYSLTAAPALDTSKGTSFSSMFAYCYSLTAVPALDTSKVSTAPTSFFNCSSLKSITFKGTNTTWPDELSFADSSLTATAVETIFNSLPTITTSRAITLSSTPAAKTLTEEQIAIATIKNWTVTL